MARLGLIECAGRALFVLALGLLVAPAAAAQDQSRRFEEVRRFSAEEARQGVAVDDRHFYAISNRQIGKYDKQSGERVGSWEGAPDGPIIHLDSGVVLDGRLYCAHSNYPGVPMVSSIEVFETATLEHVESHSFGIFGPWPPGSPPRDSGRAGYRLGSERAGHAVLDYTDHSGGRGFETQVSRLDIKRRGCPSLPPENPSVTHRRCH